MQAIFASIFFVSLGILINTHQVEYQFIGFIGVDGPILWQK